MTFGPDGELSQVTHKSLSPAETSTQPILLTTPSQSMMLTVPSILWFHRPRSLAPQPQESVPGLKIQNLRSQWPDLVKQLSKVTTIDTAHSGLKSPLGATCSCQSMVKASQCPKASAFWSISSTHHNSSSSKLTEVHSSSHQETTTRPTRRRLMLTTSW